MNRYAEIGPPQQAPFSRLKYFAVKPLFSTHDSCLYNNNLIQSMTFSQNQNCFKTDIKKPWSSDSKGFSISIVTW